MCGLVGFASNNIIHSDRKMFNTMLFLDQIRGEHSTGVAAVNSSGHRLIYKRAVNAADFLQLKNADKTITFGNRILIGHNRYATMGAKDDNNAHPFMHGKIMLAHNGTLDSKTSVNSDSRVFDTDSETIAHAFNTEDVKEVLERLAGAYALSWHDNDADTINLARNDERPLFVAHNATSIMWSSEKSILELAAKHAKVDIQGITELPVGVIWTWDVDGISKGYTEEKFTVKKPLPKVRGYLGHSNTKRNTTVGTSAVTVDTAKANVARDLAVANAKKLEGLRVEVFGLDVRSTGFTEGYTEDGELVVAHLPTDLAQLAKRYDGDAVLRGKVSSSHARNVQGRYISVLNLSSIGLDVIDVDKWVEDETNAKSCVLCETAIADGQGEIHYGVDYHTDCLDSCTDLKKLRGAI